MYIIDISGRTTWNNTSPFNLSTLITAYFYNPNREFYFDCVEIVPNNKYLLITAEDQGLYFVDL